MDTPLKRCSKCKEWRPATPKDFNRNKNSPDGLYTYCKVCTKPRALEIAKRWQRNHPDQVKQANKTYYANNKDRELARCAVYRENNRDEINSRHRKRRKQNLDKDRIKSQHRRARKRNAEGKYKQSDIDRKYKTQKAKCYYCGVSIKNGYHIDHVVPLVRNGSNWPDNLVLACQSCNDQKGDKLPHEWPKGGRLL